jgi:bacillithiol biosynthesis cysteine-adding enzyme BshC
MHPGIKSLASPIYVDAIEKSAEVVSHIRKKGSELKTDGYHVQVLVEEDYFPLFRIDDEGRRVALRKVVDGVYRSREENKEFSIVELASIARDEPARFSPGVMLRPVVQDYLLPTVCYFGGAAEIAYFAQNSAAYRVLDRPVTPIMHRQSLTVVEAKHRRALDKFGLGFTDLFDGSDRIVERVGAKQLSPGISADLDSVEESIGGALDRLDQDLSQIDRTLSDSLAKRRKKIMHHIAALQKSAARAQARKDATIERQIKAALDTLLPNGELQERILNVHSFINKYGEYFIDMLYDAVDLNDQAHRIIEL